MNTSMNNHKESLRGLSPTKYANANWRPSTGYKSPNKRTNILNYTAGEVEVGNVFTYPALNIIKELNGKEIISQDKDIEIERLKTTCFNLNNKAIVSDDLQKDIEILRARLGESEEARQELENQNHTLENQNRSLTGEVQGLENQNRSLTKQVDGLEDQNRALTQQIHGLENQNRALSGEVQGLENQNRALTTQINGLENQNRALTSQIHGLENQNRSLSGEVQGLENQNRALSSANQGLENQNRALSSEVQGLENQNRTLQNENQNLRSELQSTLDVKSQMQKDLEQAADFNITMEEKVYKSNKISLDLINQLKIAEMELGYIYVPVKTDAIDCKLAEYINWSTARPALKSLFTRESEGVYQFGSKRCNIKIDLNKIFVRVGGGYLMIDEFVDQYLPIELEKIGSKMADYRTSYVPEVVRKSASPTKFIRQASPVRNSSPNTRMSTSIRQSVSLKYI